MHSSTSNSSNWLPDLSVGERRQLRRATAGMLLTLFMLLAGIEVLSRSVFPRVSHIEQRILSDEQRTIAIRSLAADGRPTVLLVGNSLLLRALNYDKIREQLGPNVRVLRFVIENTDFLDWYYGLRRLFDEGVRPTTLVLCLNLGQTLSDETLGEYSARHLFEARDLLNVAHDTHMDTTQTSNLVIAHWSAFYASRATIRNYILNRTYPSYAHALHSLADAPPSFPAADEMTLEARTRLRMIRELCERNGSHFVFLVPPSIKGPDQILVDAGKVEQVEVEVPLPIHSLGPEYFRDRFHLNPRGAELFTDALSRDLKGRLYLAGATNGLPHGTDSTNNPGSLHETATTP